MDELKRIIYLGSIRDKIVSECLKNKNIGYLKLYVDKHNKLVTNTMEFVEGNFESEEFISFQTANISKLTPGKVTYGIEIYYSVIWADEDGDSVTIWKLKESIEWPSSGNFFE
jgi:hypothetical protein